MAVSFLQMFVYHQSSDLHIFFYSFHSLENYICWLFYQTLCVLGELRPYLVRVERTNMHSSATPDTRTLCGAAGGVDVSN